MISILFSLRYKVNFLFLILLLISLLGCIFFVNYRVSQAVEEKIHQDLHQQMQQIFQHFRQDRDQLQQYGLYLSQHVKSDVFVLDSGFLNQWFDSIPVLPKLDGLSWYDDNGILQLSGFRALGSTPVVKGWQFCQWSKNTQCQSTQVKNLYLALEDSFKLTYQVSRTQGLLWQQQAVWRWLKQPLKNKAGHLILWQKINLTVFKALYRQYLNPNDNSSLMLLQSNRIFFNYGYSQTKKGLYAVWQQNLKILLAQLDQNGAYQLLGKTRQINLLGERFVYIIAPAQIASPAFLIAYPVNKRLEFLKILYHDFILFACLLITLGLLFAAPLSRWGFSSLQQLLVATEQIQYENYQFRLPIRGKDEFAQLSSSVNKMLQKLEKQKNKQYIMSQLISRELLDTMLEGQLSQQAHFRRSTILYCDVIAFERIYNKLAPTVALDFINNYFTRIQFAIDAYNGSVDGYEGTATRVLFGLSDNYDNAVVQAIHTALSIHNAVDLFNLEVAQPLDKHLKIGIGIHYERLLLGRLGAENRRFYSALGSGLNVSQWLQQLTSEYDADILISKEAWLQAQKDPKLKALPHRYLISRQPPFAHPPVEIYQILLGAETTRIIQTSLLAPSTKLS